MVCTRGCIALVSCDSPPFTWGRSFQSSTEGNGSRFTSACVGQGSTKAKSSLRLAGPASSSPGVQALRASLDCIIKTEVDLDNIDLGDYVYYIEERCLRGPVRWRHQMPSQPSPSKALFRIYVQKFCLRPDEETTLYKSLLSGPGKFATRTGEKYAPSPFIPPGGQALRR